MRNPKPAEPRPLARLGGLLAALAATVALLACAPAAPVVPTVERPGGPPPQLKTWPVDHEIHLQWQRVRGAKSYTLYWSHDPDVAANRDHAIPGLKRTQYVHKGLTNGETYYYFLVAVDHAGKEFRAFPPIGDVPYRYAVRRYRNFMAVVPRPHDTFDTLAEQYLRDKDKGWLIREFNGERTPTPFQAVLIPLKPFEPGGLTDKGYRTVPILVYHQLTRTKPGRMAVLQTDFELQMAYLKHYRWQVITLQQFADFLDFKGQVPERAVVITFDDGWASTYHIALPILEKYGYKATLFVTNSLIGSDRKALSWQQVKALEDGGVFDVQCHTETHPNLADPAGRDLKDYLSFLSDELIASKAELKKRTGKSCQYLAYPYGAENHLVVAMAQKAGYRAAFTVDRGANPFFVSDYRVLRSMVYGTFDIQQFAENLESFSDRVLK
ncbi:MAG TPA: polysaccharide deacetylase family protein [bacterium]|nr:polysaccharide deacetylase family protein [bacterium]